MSDSAVLLRRTGAAAHAPCDNPIDEYGQPAAEYHESSLIRDMNSERGSSGAGRGRIFVGRLSGACRCERFVDGDVDAGDPGTVHPDERQKVPTVVDDGDIQVDSDFARLCLGTLDDSPGIVEAQSWCHDHDDHLHQSVSYIRLIYREFRRQAPIFDRHRVFHFVVAAKALFVVYFWKIRLAPMLPEFRDVRVVFFDAAGTLFHVRGSVGEIYSRTAARYGVECAPDIVERQFADAFHRRSAQGIVADEGSAPEASEKAWWLDIVREVFGARMSEQVLLAYFDEVFELFRGAEAWELYPDARAALSELRLRGFRLGIISNFDSRLFDLLENLGLASSFESVIVSWRAGAGKPDPLIFQRALEAMRVCAARAAHVGDSLEEDVLAAAGAGLHAILIDRKGIHHEGECVHRIESLTELCGLL